MAKLQWQIVDTIAKQSDITQSLSFTNEYLTSFSSEYAIPNHGFDPIERELQLLGIENSVLEKESIRKLGNLT